MAQNTLMHGQGHRHPMTRQVLSFFKLSLIDSSKLPSIRRDLAALLDNYGVLGRVYVAADGLNAQISIDDHKAEPFKEHFTSSFPQFASVYFNRSPFKADAAFEKLIVKVRTQVVSDGIDLNQLDTCLAPNSMDPAGFHHAFTQHLHERDDKKSIFLDIRNNYELEIGRFPKTTEIPAETFRDYMVRLKSKVLPEYDPEDTNVLMVCTGGIRCSKAGLVMRNWGWKNVNMLHGGITRYVREMGQESCFKGINFTFDGRCGEKFSTTDKKNHSESTVISRCAGCGSLCETLSNCANSSCNRMTVQCESCKVLHVGACGPGCHQIIINPQLAQLYREIGSMNVKHHRGLDTIDNQQ
jgi:UPF0176 protein